ncbi:MAG: hypothetical protein N2167_06170 [Flavobacteriales bacterium]|nr:hypothetical protein [Flavobacteriales bacterium]
MKSYYLVLILFLLSGFSLINAQKRSKLPRITVEAPLKKNQIKRWSKNNSVKEELFISASPITNSLQEEPREYEMEDLLVSAEQLLHKSQTISPIIHTRKSSVRLEMVNVNNNNSTSFKFSGESLKSHTLLFKVKDVKKTSMEVWVILLIIFYIVGLIFTVLCVLSIITWNNLTLFIVFLILAILFSAAGSLMLTLGQMGVI